LNKPNNGLTAMLSIGSESSYEITGATKRAAKLKASKNYDPGLAGLVIYVLNSGDYGWSVNPPALLKARAVLHKASLPRKSSAMSGSAGAVGSTCCGTGVS
jgi:hypothetical protein